MDVSQSLEALLELHMPLGVRPQQRRLGVSSLIIDVLTMVEVVGSRKRVLIKSLFQHLVPGIQRSLILVG